MPPETAKPTELVSILSARICHDLVSPVGAIVNGIDLIREIGAPGLDNELGMISQSANRASGLLQFYRLAFGAVDDAAEGLSRALLQERARAMIVSSRVEMLWSVPEGPALARPDARLVCQLVLCARAITGMAGVVEVVLPPAASLPVHLRVHGDGAGDMAERLAHLTGDGSGREISPRLIEFALTRETAREMGVALAITRDTGLTEIVARRD